MRRKKGNLDKASIKPLLQPCRKANHMLRLSGSLNLAKRTHQVTGSRVVHDGHGSGCIGRGGGCGCLWGRVEEGQELQGHWHGDVALVWRVLCKGKDPG